MAMHSSVKREKKTGDAAVLLLVQPEVKSVAKIDKTSAHSSFFLFFLLKSSLVNEMCGFEMERFQV